jgi:hypothetical protein
MGKVDRFEDLDIWKIAIGMAVDVYLLCDSEPLKSDWGMKRPDQEGSMLSIR